MAPKRRALLTSPSAWPCQTLLPFSVPQLQAHIQLLSFHLQLLHLLSQQTDGLGLMTIDMLCLVATEFIFNFAAFRGNVPFPFYQLLPFPLI